MGMEKKNVTVNQENINVKQRLMNPFVMKK